MCNVLVHDFATIKCQQTLKLATICWFEPVDERDDDVEGLGIEPGDEALEALHRRQRVGWGLLVHAAPDTQVTY